MIPFLLLTLQFNEKTDSLHLPDLVQQHTSVFVLSCQPQLLPLCYHFCLGYCFGYIYTVREIIITLHWTKSKKEKIINIALLTVLVVTRMLDARVDRTSIS